jgi:hypothetical protein
VQGAHETLVPGQLLPLLMLVTLLMLLLALTLHAA